MRSSELAFAAAAAANAASAAVVPRLENGLSRTPALGWNSWNQGGCSAATAQVALNTAKAFINLGLKDLGYEYINIDDCWSTHSRNSTGHLVADPNKFPNGIDGLANEIHSMGLKLGLYGDAGTLTCAGYPGSEGHEEQDAQTLAAWGVDYWKYDNCYTPCNSGSQQTCGNPAASSQTWYTKMSKYILATNKPILFSLCNWGRDSVWEWGAGVGNSWRMSVDNWQDWASVVRIGSAAGPIAQYSKPGGFNDLDMMIIGNGKLTDAQERTHFGLWAIAKSPILMGTDMTKLSGSRLDMIKNKGLLAINQDPMGTAATTFVPSGQSGPSSGQLYRYWAGPMSDGSVVVGLIAPDGAETLSVSFSDVPGLGSGTYKWTEMFRGTTGTGTGVSISLEQHDMAVYRVSKA